MSTKAIEEAAKQLQDCRRILVFDNSQKVLFSNFQASLPDRAVLLTYTAGFPDWEDGSHSLVQVNPAELQALAHVFASRTDAIRSGMVIDGKRYEVSSLALRQSETSAMRAGSCWRTRNPAVWGPCWSRGSDFCCLYAAGLHGLGQSCPVWQLQVASPGDPSAVHKGHAPSAHPGASGTYAKPHICKQTAV